MLTPRITLGITNISAEEVAVHLRGLREQGQFAIFDLGQPNVFAQVERVRDGGLHLEVSQRSPDLESLLGRLGAVSFIPDFNFPAVDTNPGDDGRVAQVIAETMALLAAINQCPNDTQVQTGEM